MVRHSNVRPNHLSNLKLPIGSAFVRSLSTSSIFPPRPSSARFSLISSRPCPLHRLPQHPTSVRFVPSLQVLACKQEPQIAALLPFLTSTMLLMTWMSHTDQGRCSYHACVFWRHYSPCAPVPVSIRRFVRSSFLPSSSFCPSDFYQLLTLCDVPAGAIAGIGEILTFYPLDVVKTRQQLSATKPLSMIPMLREIVKTEG